MRYRAVVNWTILSLWLISGVALAAPAGPSANLRRIPFLLAPRAVQRELIGTLADCGAPAKLVRSAARFDVGPIVGPGRKDYFFLFTDDYWHGPADFVHYPPASICTANYVWSMVWMRTQGDRYKSIVVPYPALYFRGSDLLLFDVDPDTKCVVDGARAWWDAGHFVTWNPRTDFVRPVTRCMTRPQADNWAQARGYRQYDFLAPSWGHPLP